MQNNAPLSPDLQEVYAAIAQAYDQGDIPRLRQLSEDVDRIQLQLLEKLNQLQNT